MISDYWAFDGTSDERCPEKGIRWSWNDYRPVLGENSWAYFIAPLQVAFLKYGSVTNIPDNDYSLAMGINALTALTKMQTYTGGVSYSPNNTLFASRDTGYDVSVENNASLLSGLKMLRYILTTKGIYLDKLIPINILITGIEKFIHDSYDPNLGYFRQGGTYYSCTPSCGTFTWNPQFAVDCQTWVMSIVHPLLIDQWFGVGTSQSIWKNTKALGGYRYRPESGYYDGLGFSNNANTQVFSGEWSLGGINMLRIFANEYSNPSFLLEADHMRAAIERDLLRTDSINGEVVKGILYSNKRYWIPFGWWANSVLSTASTGWTVLADNNYNPWYLGGAYKVNY